jgi:flagellum-specific ATP synthase
MIENKLNFGRYYEAIEQGAIVKDSGKVTQVTGQLLTGYLPGACVGSICEVFPSAGRGSSFSAEVVGFRDRNVLLMSLGDMRGVGLGSRIVLERPSATVKVGPELLGRVINGLGQPIDDLGTLEVSDERSLYSAIENPLRRKPITEPSDVGVRAINGLLTVGRGQRVGIMAGSGVGKSVLLGMMARYSDADVNVIALIGERGREVREFIEDILGEEGLKRSVVVVATGDQSPLMRMRGAFVATTIAEYFCGQSQNVLLMMDSITRFAMAQREIGLSTGEPPASKGYTPSVFSLLPKLLERAGSYDHRGSITGLYTVLVEGDDMDDPIGDAVRSIVDGHIVLTRSLAQKGHFPAIDVLQSTSRVMRNVVDREQLQLAQTIRENLATYREAEDLINIGAYKSGSNPKIDLAITLNDPIDQFLKQAWDETATFADTASTMRALLGHG